MVTACRSTKSPLDVCYTGNCSTRTVVGQIDHVAVVVDAAEDTAAGLEPMIARLFG